MAAGMAGAIGQASGAIPQIIFGAIQAHKGNKDRKRAEIQSEQELNASPVYTESPYARAMLAQAQAQNNSVNPAIQGLYNQQQQLAANVGSAAQNYAQSGGEAIQAAIAGQQMAQQNLPQIAQLQTDYARRNQGMLADAMQNMTGEYQNVFNDKVRRNDTRANFRLGQLAGANKRFEGGTQNVIGGIQGLGNAAGSLIGGM